MRMVTYIIYDNMLNLKMSNTIKRKKGCNFDNFIDIEKTFYITSKYYFEIIYLIIYELQFLYELCRSIGNLSLDNYKF